MSLTSLNIASDGLLDSPTPLTIATRGLIRIGDTTEVVIVVPETRKRRAGAGPGARYISPYGQVERFKLDKRKDKLRDIHRDDEEVLEILIQTILSGVIQ